MVTKLNPSVITDDMMYEGGIVPVNSVQDYTLIEFVKEDKLWGDVRRAAKTNKSLQAALDHAIMIYKLSKEYKDGV
jgi:hypothetical protein